MGKGEKKREVQTPFQVYDGKQGRHNLKAERKITAQGKRIKVEMKPASERSIKRNKGDVIQVMAHFRNLHGQRRGRNARERN